MAYPVYVGGNSGWDAGAVIAGGLVAGATAGLVAGAISNANAPPAVIVAAPAPPAATAAPAAADQARQSADAAQSAASEAQQAARQAQSAAAAAAPQPASPPPAPTPPGARYALGTRFAQLPEGCQPERIGPISFDHCGQDWLQPVMEGGTVAWIAVPPPLG